MNNKILLLVLAGLGLIYLASEFVFKKEQRSFDSTFLTVDTSKIDKMIFDVSGTEREVFTLEKEDRIWKANKEGFTVSANPGSITGVLSQLMVLESERVAAKSKEKWEDFEVGEDATRIQIFNGAKKVGEFLVGRFSFDQEKRKATTYLRRAGENDTYAVDGFVSMAFKQGFNSFRDNTIIKINKDDIQALTWQHGQSKNILRKIGNQWNLNDMKADSTLADRYVSNIVSLLGSDFADSSEYSSLEEPDFVFTVEANNQMNLLEVFIYHSGKEDKPFLVRSTQNPEAYFLADSITVFNKLKLEEESLLVQKTK